MLKQWKKNMIVGAAALTLTGGVAVAGLAMTSSPVSAAPMAAGLTAVQGHRGGPGGALGARGDQGEALAAQLGITVEELQAANENVRTQLAEQAGEDETGRFDRRGARVDSEVMQQMLADELGITVEQLTAATEAVRDAALAEALANGEITQEQIDRKEAAEAVGDYIDQEALLAGVLGISVDELEVLKTDREGLSALMEAQGLDREALQTALQAAYDAALADAVNAGVITQEQADLLQENDGLRGRGFGGRGLDGRRGGENGTPPADDAAPENGTGGSFTAPSGGQL